MKDTELNQFSQLFEAFKQTEDYSERMKQFEVVEVFREIIRETLKNEPLLNVHLTGLIQMFKNDCSDDNFDKYFEQNLKISPRKDEVFEMAKKLKYPGYTLAGKTAITGLSSDHLDKVKYFLNQAFSVTSVDQAMELCEEFDSEGVPQVKSGVYSPWLYYINPTIFPILNNTHTQFRGWIDMPADYPSCIRDFNLLKTKANESDLGVIDKYAHTFGRPPKPVVLNLFGKKLYKLSHGVFTKNTRNRDNDVINIFEKNKWITIGKNTGANQANNFRKAQIGDFVYICYGGSTMYCIAKILSNNKPLDKRYEQLIDGGYEWIYREIEPLFYAKDSNINNLKDDRRWFMPSGNTTFFEVPKDQLEYLNEKLLVPTCNVMIIDKEIIEADPMDDPSVDSDQQILDDNSPLNTILYGPPGTGKTYNSINHAVAIIEGKELEDVINENREDVKNRFMTYRNKGQIEFCTFHQSLSYEDFIEGIKPHSSNDKPLSYFVEDGVFKRFCTEAAFSYSNQQSSEPYEEKKNVVLRSDNEIFKKNNPKRYVLIIDEINRGNISQIFGELITLIEEDKRRGKDECLEVVLPYSGKKFGVPANLYIIGTMNTADRSVEALDSALRRRFSFVNMMPAAEILGEFKDKVSGEIIDLKEMLHSINQRLTILKDSDHTIGHAWLIGVNDLEGLKKTFKEKILPLLQEYFYNDYEKLGLVLGESFISQKAVNKGVFASFKNTDGLEDQYLDKILYQLKDVSECGASNFISIYSDKKKSVTSNEQE